MSNIRNESILLGKDFEALNILIPLHARDNPIILDCTSNKGVMWKGSNYAPIRFDLSPEFYPDSVADFHNLPIRSASIDVLVFDPPHLPSAAASSGSSKMWESRYGITDSDARRGDNVSDLFPSFLKEAKRVLRNDGILLAKIADLTHNHRYQWQHVDFVCAVREIGMTACDLLIKRDPSAGSLKSSKWKNVHHLRKCHCYWIVVRNSNRCEK